MSSKKESAITRVEKSIIDVSEADPHVTILVYGRHGSGKTRFAATAPSVLIVDINEHGTRSARTSGAKVYRVKKWEDLTHIYWFLKQGEHEFQSVALDTITGMQHMCMKHVLGEAEDRDPNREVAMPDRRAWGKVAELMKGLLLDYRNLPLNVIFTAQERVVTDEDEELTERVPDLSPGSRGIACAAVEIIGRMYNREIAVADKAAKKKTKVWENRMLVGPHEGYETKDRTGGLGRIVRTPTMPLILEAAFTQED